jgi:hypothetical protein
MHGGLLDGMCNAVHVANALRFAMFPVLQSRWLDQPAPLTELLLFLGLFHRGQIVTLKKSVHCQN